VPEVLAHCPQPPTLYYDQVAQVHLVNSVRGRVVLVGDSCQAVSLLAGQGASLALAGAHVLAEELGRAGSIGAGLQRYQDRMKPMVCDAQAAGRRAAAWFLPSSRGRLLLRRWTLHLMRLPGVDRRLATSLVGNAGRVP
jgi:2-polyprenyl-6-methoxyphenol hydroxylase-like FAD-dependent oxidoreductase